MPTKIIVSYQKQFLKNGTVYDQTIKIPKSMKDRINKEIDTATKTREHSVFFNNHDFMYLNEMTLDSEPITLTQCRLIKSVLEKEPYDVTRIKQDRNTIIQFV